MLVYRPQVKRGKYLICPIENVYLFQNAAIFFLDPENRGGISFLSLPHTTDKRWPSTGKGGFLQLKWPNNTKLYKKAVDLWDFPLLANFFIFCPQKSAAECKLFGKLISDEPGVIFGSRLNNNLSLMIFRFLW